MVEDETPSAEHVGVDVAPDEEAVGIEVNGEAPLSGSEYVPRVYIDVGDSGSRISLTLTPAAVRGLRDDLADGLDEAQAEAEKWSGDTQGQHRR
jgi:hypothetical protein